MMGFSPLANMQRRIPDVGRSSARNSRISGFTIHHQAGVDAHGEATRAGREVSANYWITNAGDILPNVDESRRAWTTGAVGYPAGARSDHRNITVEVSNSPEGVRSGSYAISDSAFAALSELIGDVFKRHGLGAVRRGIYDGVAVHRDFVPTNCPGDYIMANLSTIINNAEVARTGVSGDPLGGVMNYYDNKQAFRSDLRDIIRRHVPRAEMNSAFTDSKGRTVRTNIATEIRRNTRVGYQNRIKNDRAETKIDVLTAKVDQLEGIIKALGEHSGVAGSTLSVNAEALADVEERSRARLADEAERDAAELDAALDELAESDDEDES